MANQIHTGNIGVTLGAYQKQTTKNVIRSVQVTSYTRIDFTGGFTDVLPFRAKQWVKHINMTVDL